jgi:hypothetical protein
VRHGDKCVHAFDRWEARITSTSAIRRLVTRATEFLRISAAEQGINNRPLSVSVPVTISAAARSINSFKILLGLVNKKPVLRGCGVQKKTVHEKQSAIATPLS